ncbi:hypothetical protein ACQ86N_12990 [Puia sp. P3]|uniref:SMODS-associated NUDIX domain-containing protein n=1 Tax=Puia sp. P3 TaxID=3423952 RepID=UPI003D677E37
MSGKGVFSLILGSVGWLIFGLLHDGDWKKIAIGAFFAGVLELLGYLWENRGHWKMMKMQFIHPRRAIRVTTAYLYRIEYNGKYLLIKRHKKDVVGYQPVGGAYKYYKGETRDLFNKLGITLATSYRETKIPWMTYGSSLKKEESRQLPAVAGQPQEPGDRPNEGVQ